MTSVTVIGLGAMGLGMARSLLRAGVAVRGCDLRSEARDALAAYLRKMPGITA